VISGNVLTNDSDVDSSGLAASLVAGPTNGMLALNPDGSFAYTPAPNYAGADAFTYRAGDGAAMSVIATVTLAVTPVNDPPVAVADSFSGSQGLAVTGNVLTNDADVEATTLTAMLVSGPTNGVLTFTANGVFSYTANVGFLGSDSFSYKANDGGADSAPVAVTITVAGKLYSTWEIEHFSAEEILAGSADETGDFDWDGLVNLVEYALGTDPRVPNGGPVPGIANDALGHPRLTLSFTRPIGLPGLTYTVECSSDLTAWEAVTAVEITPSADHETVVARDDQIVSGQTRRFLRLRVQRNAP
jgi:hypothetical protein